MRSFLLIIVAIFMPLGVARPVYADNIVARWIQLGPGSSSPAPTLQNFGDAPTGLTPTILARAVIDGGACPSAILDGGPALTMTKRFDAATLTGGLPVGSGFSDYPDYFVSAGAVPGRFGNGDPRATESWTLCEAIVPSGHVRARIGDVDLALPVANPKRILVLGDSGCRLNAGTPKVPPRDTAHATGGVEQNCLDPARFPLRVLSEQASALHPDLIVHVGDYFYRDSSCMKDGKEFVPGCTDPASPAYEPWGDTFDAWNGDVLLPARPLLAAAPWVMVRGNHESCGRGGRGWFALLDPHPYDPALVRCQRNAGAAIVSGDTPVYSGDFRPTYVVPAGGENLLVHDGSYADDYQPDVNLARNFELDIRRVLAALPVGSRNVFVTHRPPYGMVASAVTSAGNATEQFMLSGNALSGSIFTNGVPETITLLLSGHIHLFQYIQFADVARFPPQLIVGTGGDSLDQTINPDKTNPDYALADQDFTVRGVPDPAGTAVVRVTRAFAQARFGFALLEPTGDGYIVDVHTIDGQGEGRCTITLAPRGIKCWR